MQHGVMAYGGGKQTKLPSLVYLSYIVTIATALSYHIVVSVSLSYRYLHLLNKHISCIYHPHRRNMSSRVNCPADAANTAASGGGMAANSEEEGSRSVAFQPKKTAAAAFWQRARSSWRRLARSSSVAARLARL
jgi:hypothetical protein